MVAAGYYASKFCLWINSKEMDISVSVYEYNKESHNLEADSDICFIGLTLEVVEPLVQ